MPAAASPENRIMVTMPSARAARSTGLNPFDWALRPQNPEVSTTMTAAAEMVTPNCHSGMPSLRERGAMIGLRVI